MASETTDAAGADADAAEGVARGFLRSLTGDDRFWKAAFVGVPVLYLCVFFLFGLGFIFLISFWSTEQYTLIPTWTLANYVTIATGSPYPFFLAKSLVMAVAVTVTCLLVGYPVAYYIERGFETHQQLSILLLIATPFFVGTLIRVFAHQGLIGPTGMLNLVLANLGVGPIDLLGYNNVQTFIGEVYLWLPFMILSVFLSLQNIDFDLLEAARDAGAGRLRAFYEVTWPLSRPGVVVGSALVFIPTLSSNITSEFVGGPNGALIGNIIHSAFGESGEWAFGAALAVVVVLLATVFVGLLVRTIPWKAYDLGGERA